MILRTTPLSSGFSLTGSPLLSGDRCGLRATSVGSNRRVSGLIDKIPRMTPCIKLRTERTSSGRYREIDKSIVKSRTAPESLTKVQARSRLSARLP